MSIGPAERLIPLLLILALGACASHGPVPQTGDVSFRLRWDGPADLDLHVVDPNGRHTGVPLGLNDPDPQALIRAAREMAERDAENPDAPKGHLDIDCNASPDQICTRPIENIFWPTGTAPEGRYEVWVRLFQRLQTDEEIPYAIEIRRGETVVETHRGKVSNIETRSPRYGYSY